MLLVPRAHQVSSTNSSTLKNTGYSSCFVNSQTLRLFKLRCSIQHFAAKRLSISPPSKAHQVLHHSGQSRADPKGVARGSQEGIVRAFQSHICSSKKGHHLHHSKASKQGETQRLHAKGGQPGMWGAIACATSAVGDNHGDQNVKTRAATTSRISFAPVETYPWDKFTTKLMLRFADTVWFVGKWLAVPALILVALRDVFFTVKAGEELSIPFGLLVGTVLTGILKETLSNLDIDFQHSVLPWHLVELGLLFVLLRICATVMDSSFQAFIAIGGLWQTIRFALDWKARKEEPVHEEEDS